MEARGAPGDIEFADLPRWVVESERGDQAVEADGRSKTPWRTEAEQSEFAEVWSRAGVRLEANERYYLCPFHDDHQPSLHIDAAGCRWFCFGCNIGGGVGKLRKMLGERGAPPLHGRLHAGNGRGLPVTLWGQDEVDIVGESGHQDQLLSIAGGRRRYGGVDVGVVAELVHDPTNRFDPQAIEVRVDGGTVGYVRRADTQWIAPLIDDSIDEHGFATCRAFVRGGWDRGRGDVGAFGVVLSLPRSVE